MGDKRLLKKVIMIILVAISFTGCKSLKKRAGELDALARANSSEVDLNQEFHKERDEFRMVKTTYFDVKEYRVNDLFRKVLSNSGLSRPKIDATQYNKEYRTYLSYLSSTKYKYNSINFAEYDFLNITYGASLKEEKIKVIMALVNRELQTFVFSSTVVTEDQVNEVREWVAKIDTKLK